MIVKAKFGLSKSFIKQALALKATLKPFEAVVDSGSEIDDSKRDTTHRQTEVRWINYDDCPPLHDEMLRIVNAGRVRLGVTGRIAMEPGIQMATYREGHHFSWHSDGKPSDATRRVVSVSVLLTTDFSGGQLEFKTPGAPKLKKPGDVIMFNSSEVHRVAPVTRGVRDSLVLWFTLPR